MLHSLTSLSSRVLYSSAYPYNRMHFAARQQIDRLLHDVASELLSQSAHLRIGRLVVEEMLHPSPNRANLPNLGATELTYEFYDSKIDLEGLLTFPVVDSSQVRSLKRSRLLSLETCCLLRQALDPLMTLAAPADNIAASPGRFATGT